MSSTDDQISELTAQIDRLVEIFHAGRSPYSSPGTSKSKAHTARDAKPRGHSGDFGARELKSAVAMMHGGVRDFTYHLGGLAGKFAAVGLALDLFKGALNIGGTFNKMADIGQTFNGSMLEMMRQVGASGLSLEQFSGIMTKHATLTGMMTEAADANTHSLTRNASEQTVTTRNTQSAFMAMQKSVRNTMEDMGFYGMTLGEITEATADYMDVLRTSGLMAQLRDDQQKKMIETFITDATGFSHLFNVSREQIIKTTADAMQQPSTAMTLSNVENPEQRKRMADAAERTSSFLAALPEGKDLVTMMMAQFNNPGYVHTTEGLQLQSMGLGKLNYLTNELAMKARSGVTPSNSDLAANATARAQTILDDYPQLKALQKSFPEYGPEIEKLFKYATDMQSKYYDRTTHAWRNDKMTADMTNPDNPANKMHALTKDIMIFESVFHDATGSFQQAFYGSIAKMLGDSTDNDKFKKMSAGLTFLLSKLGTALGSVLGLIGSMLASPTFTTAVSSFADMLQSISISMGSTLDALTVSPEFGRTLTNLETSFGHLGRAIADYLGNSLFTSHNIETVIGWFGKLADILGTVFKGFEKLNTFLQSGLDKVGLGGGNISTIVAIAVPVVIAMLLKNALFKGLGMLGGKNSSCCDHLAKGGFFDRNKKSKAETESESTGGKKKSKPKTGSESTGGKTGGKRGWFGRKGATSAIEEQETVARKGGSTVEKEIAAPRRRGKMGTVGSVVATVGGGVAVNAILGWLTDTIGGAVGGMITDAVIGLITDVVGGLVAAAAAAVAAAVGVPALAVGAIAAAVGAAGWIGYKLWGGNSKKDVDDQRKNLPTNEKGDNQSMFERSFHWLLGSSRPTTAAAGTPNANAPAASNNAAPNTSAASNNAAPNTSAASNNAASNNAALALQYQQAQAAAAKVKQDYDAFVKQHGSPTSTGTSNAAGDPTLGYSDPNIQQQYSAIVARQESSSKAVSSIETQAEKNVAGLDNGPESLQNQKMIDALKNKFGYTDQQLQSLPDDGEGSITVGDETYPMAVTGLYKEMVKKSLQQQPVAPTTPANAVLNSDIVQPDAPTQSASVTPDVAPTDNTEEIQDQLQKLNTNKDDLTKKLKQDQEAKNVSKTAMDSRDIKDILDQIAKLTARQTALTQRMLDRQQTGAALQPYQ